MEQPTQQSSQQEQHRKKKAAIGGAILLFVSVVFVPVYFLLLQPENAGQVEPVEQHERQESIVVGEEIDTSTWQTYRNNKFGFEIKHPPQSSIEEKTGPTWIDVVIESPEYRLGFFAGTRESGGPYGFSQVAWEKVLNVDGTEIRLVASAFEETDEITSETSLFLASDRVCYKENKRYDHFSSFITLDKLLANEQEILGIFKSFRYFGDDCGKFDTSAWQTYRNEEFGFELKYPEGWSAGFSEKRNSVVIQKPYTTSFIEISAGRSDGTGYVVSADTNVCYTHYAPDFPHWDLDSGERGTPIYTADAIELKIWISPDAKRYYACEANPGFTFEAVTYGDVSKSEFNQILATFRFVENEPLDEVVVATDKTEYVRGENVTITIENQTEITKEMDPWYSIERFTNNRWTQVPYITCPCNAVCNAPQAGLQSGERIQSVWNQEEGFCDNFKEISSQAVPGRYRIKLTVNNVGDTQENWKTIYSNEFLIK